MSYQDYYAPDWWYEPDCEPDYECSACDEKQKRLENAQEFFTGVAEMLYGKTNLNIDDLDNMMEELAGYLDVKLPEGDNILRKNSDVLQDWVKFNNNYLKKLA
jgi:hypothetical protein